MRLIKSFEVEGYRNIEYTKLDDLKDFNILIGPNNCGKTNVLNSINLLSMLSVSGVDYFCHKCNEAKNKIKNINVSISLSLDDYYLKRGKAKLSFLFKRDAIDEIVPRVLEKQEKILAGSDYKDELTLKSEDGLLRGEHISIFTHDDIIEELRKSILFCPEGRLQGYRDSDFKNYSQGNK